MGLFSSRKKTYVSSVVYNLAGDEAERPEVLKTMVLGSMIGNPNFSISRTLQEGYSKGQAMRLRGFYNWAKTNYTEVGIPTDSIQGTREASVPGIEAAIADAVGSSVKVAWVEISSPDAAFWAMKWMLANMPERMNDEWRADADFDGTNYVLVINFEDGVTDPVVLVAENFNPNSKYIFAQYQSDKGASTEPAITGPVVQLGEAAFPSTAGWNLFSSILAKATIRLNRTVTSTAVFSDGRPNEVTTVTTGTNQEYDVFRGVYTRKIYQGVGADGRQTSLQEFLILTQDRKVAVVHSTENRVENLPGGVTKTITDEIDQDTPVYDRTSQHNTQLVIHSEWGEPQLFIYRHGSGYESLDGMITGKSLDGGYLPLIPLRLDNKFLSDSYKPELYEKSKKAYKKAIGGKYEELVKKIKENDDVNEIDFAYVVFGVVLNTKENTAKKYLYHYFSRFLRQQQTTAGDYNAWSSGSYDEYTARHTEWADWYAAQQAAQGTNVGVGGGKPSEPPTGTYTTPPATSAQIKTSDKEINFNMEILWQSITETTGEGLAKEDAKKGDVWLVGAGSTNHPFFDRFTSLIEDLEVGDTKIFWQVTDNSWKCLTIKGLQHKNHIWNGKYVETGATEALSDEDETGFIIPLHIDVLKEMSLVDATQMTTASAYLVLNCYQIVKKKWYQRGWFKVLLVIVVVVLTILYPPAGAAAGAGLLGPAAAVGAALGFSGLVAIIVGTIANMIAAMIVTRLITYVSVALLGEKFGAIIGAIASMFALQAGTALSMGQSLSSIWPNLMNVTNLMNLTNALGSGIAGAMGADAQGYMQQTQDLLKDYEKQTKELSERYAAEFGYGTALFNPMTLTGVGEFFNESEAVFLSRTLMTGSDIAEMSMDMVTNFTDLTLAVDLNH